MPELRGVIQHPELHARYATGYSVALYGLIESVALGYFDITGY